MKPSWVIVLALGLAGCATDGHETVMAPITAELGNRMATDSIKQLQALYPPGRTQLNLGQTVPQTDGFGTALLKALREKGYAVRVYDAEPSKEATGGLEFRYCVDKPETRLIADLYRVKLNVGNTVMTRAYTTSNQSAQPAGAWAVRE